jgi:hypothetical protein
MMHVRPSSSCEGNQLYMNSRVVVLSAQPSPPPEASQAGQACVRLHPAALGPPAAALALQVPTCTPWRNYRDWASCHGTACASCLMPQAQPWPFHWSGQHRLGPKERVLTR